MIDEAARELEIRLAEFGVTAEVIERLDGPSATTFHLRIGKGERSSKVVQLADDIALAMRVRSCRVYIEREKQLLAIELANASQSLFSFEEFSEQISANAAGKVIPLAIGRTAGGGAVVADLAGMPHLLIAGSTGSGKSVALHAIAMSIVKHRSIDDVKIIIIDPKFVEFNIYRGLPHLLCPVVTEPDGAVRILSWVASEMNDRYRKLAEAGSRDIDTFNSLGIDRLPRLVVIVDELAELMLIAKDDVENKLQRLAQKGRAAGVHLILATQRPSVDVVTGTIKSNFTTRLTFRLSSKIDSRTIIGRGGAEWLLGSGDALFSDQGRDPVRVQAPFVSESFVRRTVESFDWTEPASIGSFVCKTDLTLPDEFQRFYSGLADAVYRTADRRIETTATTLASEYGLSPIRVGLLISKGADALKSVGLVAAKTHSGTRKIVMSAIARAN